MEEINSELTPTSSVELSPTGNSVKDLGVSVVKGISSSVRDRIDFATDNAAFFVGDAFTAANDVRKGITEAVGTVGGVASAVVDTIIRFSWL